MVAPAEAEALTVRTKEEAAEVVTEVVVEAAEAAAGITTAIVEVAEEEVVATITAVALEVALASPADSRVRTGVDLHCPTTVQRTDLAVPVLRSP